MATMIGCDGGGFVHESLSKRSAGINSTTRPAADVFETRIAWNELCCRVRLHLSIAYLSYPVRGFCCPLMEIFLVFVSQHDGGRRQTRLSRRLPSHKGCTIGRFSPLSPSHKKADHDRQQRQSSSPSLVLPSVLNSEMTASRPCLPSLVSTA
jgi:hypothetical protein